ncbi:MAG: bifunctional folylpolyglutamate synthase/dihydrofolate synthase [Spirochaetales bacterium]|nr:bifunctional folylpolyglutamate synthase/dihydrofolate synthase [Spirochaetales bacterium]
MKFTDVDTAFSYFEAFTNLAKTSHYTVRTYRLDRMAGLLDHFQHPEHSFKSIHIAGSKGKGSTAVFIRSGLTAVGYKTGLFVSPHVSTYRERFMVDGRFIPDAVLLETINKMISHLETFSFSEETGYTKPTTFELLTLLSFLLFKETRCDWAVIETGLGGRLDATNVIQPVLCVITSIELEHTAILGNTIEKIAAEKAGIIKHKTPVVIGLLKDEAEKTIRRIAVSRDAELHSLKEKLDSISTQTSLSGELCSINWKDKQPVQLFLKLRGSFQADNATLALLALETAGVYAGGNTIRALENTFIPGRLELLQDTPPVFIDGAHTEQSIIKLYDSFRQMFPDKEGSLIFGAVVGKNHELMADYSIRCFKRIIISTPGSFKESNPEALFNLFTRKKEELQLDCTITLEKDPGAALNVALEEITRSKSPKTPILVAGSFYMAAEIRGLYPEIQ